MTSKLIAINEERSMRCTETGAPFVTIQYGPAKSSEMISLASYQIISCLKKENDLILEIDSVLLSTPANERLEKAIRTKTEFDALGLLSKSHKSRIPQTPSLIERLFSGNAANESEVFQALFLIPTQIWKLENFWRKLPIYGARYYVLKEGAAGVETMDEIFDGVMRGEKKTAIFDLNIFDCSVLGQMGVYAYGMDKDEIKKRLDCLFDKQRPTLN